MSIGSCRAYFELKDLDAGELSSNVNVLVLNFGDDASALDHLPFAIDPSDASWYTIDGRKLSAKPTDKGVYINNCKTLLVQ